MGRCTPSLRLALSVNTAHLLHARLFDVIRKSLLIAEFIAIVWPFLVLLRMNMIHHWLKATSKHNIKYGLLYFLSDCES